LGCWYFEPDGRRRGKVFDRKIDAERFLREIGTSIDRNSHVDPSRGKITMSPFGDKWLATQGHLKPSTYARCEGIVSKHIKPRWGTTPLVKITHEDGAMGRSCRVEGEASRPIETLPSGRRDALGGQWPSGVGYTEESPGPLRLSLASWLTCWPRLCTMHTLTIWCSRRGAANRCGT
jgi:hypothetical protein